MSGARVLTKSENTIANILGAAEKLFVARNYAEVTIDQIAEACEITKGAVYHHFASKEALYLAMMSADFAMKKDMHGAAIESATTCRERLRCLTKAFFSLPRFKIELSRLVRRDINIFGEPARTQLVEAYQASLPEIVEQAVRDGIADGELAPGDARLLSWQFVAMVEVTLGEHADSMFGDVDEKLEHILSLFFHGAAAPGNGASK